MKCIGHVATGVLAATPLIYLQDRVALFATPELRPYHLLWWVGIFAVLPDIDIILSRFTPIKHRGFASHSLWTALVLGGLVLGAAAFFYMHPVIVTDQPAALPVLEHLARWCTPFTALLAFLAVFVHLLGDAMTKTGVPLLVPEQGWHIPVIGGYAAFDNYFLNAIPLAIAGYTVHALWGYGPNILRTFGHLHDLVPGL